MEKGRPIWPTLCGPLTMSFELLLLDQFNLGHLSTVATTWAELDDSKIATGAILISRCNIVKELRDDVIVLNLLQNNATGMEITSASPCDHLLSVRTKHLRLGMGCRDLLVQNQIRRQIRENLSLMRRRTTETLTPLWAWHQATLPSTSA